MLVQCVVILFIYLQTTSAGNTQTENPLVATPLGKIQGSHSESYSGRVYSQFFSIPYAQPPVGELRFREPLPIKEWHGIWVANFTTVCAQWDHSPNGGSYSGQEDCLYLNIFVPRSNPSDGSKLLDVIFDIHGGGLNFGSNYYYTGEKHIMDKDVVFVTVNYRLGPLGFLSTEDEVVPGNNGMKDQVAAMKWVKENIKYFGGNPDSITITGLSAGGSSVQFHYLSPLSKGLFKGGISLSGTALCPWPLQENALKQTQQLAEAVGCTQKSTAELINCMKTRPALQICEGTKIFRPWLYNPFSVFGIVVEKHGDKPFLTGHPYELLAKGKVHDLPWITSIVSHEGLYPVVEFIANEKYLSELDENWDNLAAAILHYEHTIDPKLKSSVAQKIREHYFKDKPISFETNQELIQAASDRLFIVDAEKAARLQAKSNKSPTYFYYFTYESEVAHSFVDIFNYTFNERPGICHGDDLAFIFNYKKLPLKKYSENDFKMREILLNMWTSFARTGKPDLSGTEWIPVSGEDNQPFDYLHIISPHELIMKKADELGNRHFWDSLKFKENEELFQGGIKEEL